MERSDQFHVGLSHIVEIRGSMDGAITNLGISTSDIVVKGSGLCLSPRDCSFDITAGDSTNGECDTVLSGIGRGVSRFTGKTRDRYAQLL